MTENPLMVMMFQNSSFAGEAENVENEIMPLESQLTMTPGTHCLVATASSQLEQDFVVATMLDAQAHSQAFPDWEERLLRSYVLCDYWSEEDRTTNIGWFSRVKLMPISDEHYESMEDWRTAWPDTPPSWVVDYLRDYTDQLSRRAPEWVPHAVTCPVCTGRDVSLRVFRQITFHAVAGQIIHDDETKFIPLTEPTIDSSHIARLICGDCGSTADLEDEEWVLPGYSN